MPNTVPRMKTGIGVGGLRFRRHHDLAAVIVEKAGDVGDAHEKLLAGNLPGRPGRGRIRQPLPHLPRRIATCGAHSGMPAISPGKAISLVTESPETR
jgi:hypothetical protein